MADTITSVVNLDIQLLDESRADTTTIKLDNPKDNITREQVSSAFQPAFANGWFLTNKGGVATYLGDVTINQSIKTRLDGQDFYVTPNAISLTTSLEQTDTAVINVSGATVQGVNITDIVDSEDSILFLAPTVTNNGLTVNINLQAIARQDGVPCTFNVRLIILGTEVTIPGTATVV